MLVVWRSLMKLVYKKMFPWKMYHWWSFPRWWLLRPLFPRLRNIQSRMILPWRMFLGSIIWNIVMYLDQIESVPLQFVITGCSQKIKLKNVAKEYFLMIEIPCSQLRINERECFVSLRKWLKKMWYRYSNWVMVLMQSESEKMPWMMWWFEDEQVYSFFTI